MSRYIKNWGLATVSVSVLERRDPLGPERQNPGPRMDTTTDTAAVHKQVGRFISTPQALRVATDTRVSLHCTLGSDRLPPLAGRETNADNSPDQSAKWWESEKIEKPQVADVGMTGLCVD